MRRWKHVCAAHEHCSDCPVSQEVCDTHICRILVEDFEESKIEAFVKMVCAEYARLEGDVGDDAQDNDLSR